MEEYYMKYAIKELKKALNLNEVPVGAIIVKNGKIISKGYNKKENKKNTIMHAEIIAIQNACKKIKDWRLNDCELYVTMEPCLMCLGAIVESRIKKIYYGVENEKYKELNKKIYEKENIKFVSNVMNFEIKKILRNFFSQIRNK